MTLTSYSAPISPSCPLAWSWLQPPRDQLVLAWTCFGVTSLVPWTLTTSNCAFKAIHPLRAHFFHLPKRLLGCACLHRVGTPPLRCSQQSFCSECHPSRQVRLCHTSLSDDIIFAVFLPEPTLHSSRGLQLLPDSPSNAVENDLWILISIEDMQVSFLILFLGPVL